MGFVKTFFATLLAIFTSFVLLFLIGTIIVVATIASQTPSEPYVRSGTVLDIRLGNTLAERPVDDPFMMLFSDPSRVPVTLEGLVENLEKAASDTRIDGIHMRANAIGAPWTSLVSLREAMLAFREESGKFIYFSTDDIGLNEQAYFLATAADSIFAPPETFFEFDGFFIQTMYVKDFLDNIGVQAEVFSAGAYKSATEGFTRNSMSEEDREQLSSIVQNAADTFVEAVSEHTGTSVEELNTLMSEASIFTSRAAYEAGLIDKLVYPDELTRILRMRVNGDEETSVRTVSYSRYSRASRSATGLPRNTAKERIAVIHASGAIMPSVDEPFLFPSSTTDITFRNFNRNLKAALDDDDVKAIVLRINSPGGSGATSDLIWNAIRKASEKKPVIASMGSVAASGGYYMAMAADTIVASPNTITGSIGVFGMILNAQELLNEKIGIQFDDVRSHENALWLRSDQPLSPAGRRLFQSYIDDFYDVFLDRVALSRDMSKEQVHEVAQGRVWTGNDAMQAGLVDVLGDLQTAIVIAAEKAELEQYQIRVLPESKSIFELLASSAETRINALFRPSILDVHGLDPLLRTALNDPRGVMARIPFDYVVH